MAQTKIHLFLTLAQAWETAADLHEKAMQRNQGFAKPGEKLYDFYLAESARDEIRAKLCADHAKSLREVLNQFQTDTAESLEEPDTSLVEANHSTTGL